MYDGTAVSFLQRLVLSCLLRRYVCTSLLRLRRKKLTVSFVCQCFVVDCGRSRRKGKVFKEDKVCWRSTQGVYTGCTTFVCWTLCLICDIVYAWWTWVMISLWPKEEEGLKEKRGMLKCVLWEPSWARVLLRALLGQMTGAWRWGRNLSLQVRLNLSATSYNILLATV